MTIIKHSHLYRIGFFTLEQCATTIQTFGLDVILHTREKKYNTAWSSAEHHFKAIAYRLLPHFKVATTIQPKNNQQIVNEFSKHKFTSMRKKKNWLLNSLIVMANNWWRAKCFTFVSWMSIMTVHLEEKFLAFLSTLEANIFGNCYILQHNRMTIVFNNHTFNFNYEKKHYCVFSLQIG